MPLKLTCPNPACAKRYSIPDAAAGSSIRCKACGETFVADADQTTVRVWQTLSRRTEN
jgi:hypothetical protein